MTRTPILAIVILVVAAIAGVVLRKPIERQLYKPTPSTIPQNTTETKPPARDIEVVAENLQIPWEIAFLASGEMLVTERPGNLLKIGKDRQIIKIEGVQHRGEGGLLGLTLHPKFKENQIIYLYLTTKTGDGLSNRVERYKLTDAKLSDRKVILENIPGAQFHDGGRIAFGPDSKLYITTGDAGQDELAQDQSSLAGKILRLNDDGSIPADNPFQNATWSYGHRNSQGLAWDDQGQLWATEHGPSGAQSGCDELNLIEKGRNYGWPAVRCEQAAKAFTDPVIQSGRNDTWAPAGAAFLNGQIFFGGLRGESLYEANVKGNKLLDADSVPPVLKQHLRGQFGRIRAVVLGPDGFLYITTSNTDGRGSIRSGDDKIIRVNPASLQ